MKLYTAVALLAVILSFAGFASAQSSAPSKSIPAIAQAADGAVVSIITSDKDGKPLAQGSGVFVSKDGRVLTNYHVIKEAASAAVKFPDGAFYAVDGVVAFNEARDLAIIKAHGQNFRTVMLGNSDQVRVGDAIVAIGNPLGLNSTVSSGIVSGIRTIEDEGGKFLQITAPISPGSSGGPLFNMAGEVIGVTAMYLKDGENLNFAIPINDAKLLLAEDSKAQAFSSLPVEPTPPVETHKDVSQILNWIQSHLEAIERKATLQISGGVPVFSTYTVAGTLSFKGCQVTTTRTLTYTSSASTAFLPGAPPQNYPAEKEQTIETQGPLDLGSLDPNHISIDLHSPDPCSEIVPKSMCSSKSAEEYWLKVRSSEPVPLQTGNESGVAADQSLHIIFATQEIAERQQKAWHDAIDSLWWWEADSRQSVLR